MDLTVVYFALGSPFGVYQVTRGGMRTRRSAAAAAVHFVLWPVFALVLLRESLVNHVRSQNELEFRVEDIASRLESLAFTKGSMASLFEYREVFGRYTGLTIALKIQGSARCWKDLFSISRHENVERASVCLLRRNQNLLSFHQMRARNDFIHLISNMMDSHPQGDQIVTLIMELGELIRDPKMTSQFSSAQHPKELISARAAAIHSRRDQVSP